MTTGAYSPALVLSFRNSAKLYGGIFLVLHTVKRCLREALRHDNSVYSFPLPSFHSNFYFYINMKQHNYFVYILTNPAKTVLYIGVTNDIGRRLYEHFENRGNPKSFAGRYHCYNLVYYERFQFIDHAIEREKELKDWNRKRKEELISSINPDWNFLNDEVY